MDYDKLTKAELIRRLKASQRSASTDTQQLLHDLQVHQVELEAQNEELRGAQAKLEESRDRYAELYDFAPVGYVTLDEHGTIVQINLTGAAMLGVERGRVQGTLFRSYLAGRQVPAFGDYLDRVFSSTDRQRHTACLTRRDGGIVDVRIESVLAYHDGKIYCQSALIDISEQLQLEARLREQAHQLLELDRRKDDFLAMLGHELRNPLVPIQNAVQILRVRGVTDPATVAWALDLIGRQLAHLRRLVDDLLDVERLVHGKIRFEKKPLDLVALVRQSIETSDPHAAHQRLSAMLPSEPVTVYGDATRLTQVIDNLLTNAKLSTADGGAISVRVLREDGEAVLQVTDTGSGIEAEMLPHIFEPFVQGDPGRGGLGLGLTLAQQLVHEHGGTVTADSAGPGQGSTFTVCLPMFGETAPQTLPLAAARTRHDHDGRRVLIVEDNRDVAASLTALLDSMGHAVKTTYDGESAVAMAPEFDPEVAFVDLALPGIDGFEVASRLRASRAGRSLILVAFTGFGGDDVGKRVRDAGFDAYLLKPGSPEALAGIFARC